MQKRLKLRLRLLAQSAAAGLVLVGGGAFAQTPAPTVAAALETAPSSQDAVNAAVLVRGGPGQSDYIAGAAELGGVEIYGMDGARVGAVPAGEVTGVDVRYGVPLNGRTATVLAVMDAQNAQLRLFEFDSAAGKASDVTARPIKFDFAGESLCLLRSARDGELYAILTGGDGEVEQWHVFDAGGGKLDARLARRMHLASEVGYCAADDASSDLYLSEQAVGVWRFGGDPESIVVPEIVDIVKFGHIAEEAGGVAIYDGGPGARYLVASNASADELNVYDREKGHAFVGAFKVEGGAVDGVQAAGGLFASSLAAGAGLPGGVLITADDKNDGALNYKAVSWAQVAQTLKLNAGAPQDPRAGGGSKLATVRPTVETKPVETGGDAADDPAIWVNRADPARSLIIATQKQSGLYVYDLSGAVVQFLPDGKMNNVDLRDGFKLGGETVSLVAASDRTNDAIALYKVDPATRKLVNVADGIQATGLTDPYGLCMYRSKKTGKTFVFITDGVDENARFRQWELIATPKGKVRAKLVRETMFATQAEGCVADDETGALYVAEEDIALYRMGAEPSAGKAMTVVAAVKDNPALKDDLEGVGLYDLGGGKGYVVVSSQGNDTYALFDREGANAYIGSFAVVGDGKAGIDGISETDGLEVSSANLGPAFPHGLFIAQDGRNISPPDNQNYKLVPWDLIAERLGLKSR